MFGLRTCHGMFEYDHGMFEVAAAGLWAYRGDLRATKKYGYNNLGYDPPLILIGVFCSSIEDNVPPNA